MGMFDTLRVVGADRERFRAPWGTVYDDFQSKNLYVLLPREHGPQLATFVLEAGVLRVQEETNAASDWYNRHAGPVTRSCVAHVYAFARESPQASGWVEWEISVVEGRVANVTLCQADPPEVTL